MRLYHGSDEEEEACWWPACDMCRSMGSGVGADIRGQSSVHTRLSGYAAAHTHMLQLFEVQAV